MKKIDKMKGRTVADIALHASMIVNKHWDLPYRVDPDLRNLIMHAHRFTLDGSASEFLADLVFANYPKGVPLPGNKIELKHTKKTNLAGEMTRTLARLPHKLCWFEYDNQKYTKRAEELFPLHHKGEEALRIGWLLQQHPSIDTAFRATVFGDWGDETDISQQPFDLIWTTDETLLPWDRARHSSVDDNVFATAVGCLRRVGMTFNTMFKFMKGRHDLYSPSIEGLMITAGMELRRIMTLLSTINDIPVGVRSVEPSHGYMARKKYQKFLAHTLITLNLPKGRDPHKLARSIIAISRRRAHQVRGHWRRDWRHEGNRVWIKEHQRGDASLGFVTHDYAVEHDNQ